MTCCTANTAALTLRQRVEVREGHGITEVHFTGVIIDIRGQVVVVRPGKIGVFQMPDHYTNVNNVTAL